MILFGTIRALFPEGNDNVATPEAVLTLISLAVPTTEVIKLGAVRVPFTTILLQLKSLCRLIVITFDALVM